MEVRTKKGANEGANGERMPTMPTHERSEGAGAGAAVEFVQRRVEGMKDKRKACSD